MLGATVPCARCLGTAAAEAGSMTPAVNPAVAADQTPVDPSFCCSHGAAKEQVSAQNMFNCLFESVRKNVVAAAECF